MLQPEALIGGYELIRRIGRGGMAEVWVAQRTTKGRVGKYVAIKAVDDRHVGDSRYSRMFKAEAELSSLLTHANIVQVFDEGEDDGRSYLVMEWIDGVNLLKLHSALGSVERDEAWRHKIISYIIGQLLHALSYAHSIRTADGNPLGIVHRDVSPQNVLISNHGEVKLTDFGVAHHVLEESSGVHVKGKVRYMAPEQLGGKTRDPRIDLYAVGAILHELLDGRRFRHHVEDQREMYLEVLSGKVPVLARRVPVQLDALRLGLLAPDPEKRIASADLALEQLERFPGYGDARRDLKQVCGDFTGVMQPRVGPGQSEAVAAANAGAVRVEVSTGITHRAGHGQEVAEGMAKPSGPEGMAKPSGPGGMARASGPEGMARALGLGGMARSSVPSSGHDSRVADPILQGLAQEFAQEFAQERRGLEDLDSRGHTEVVTPLPAMAIGGSTPPGRKHAGRSISRTLRLDEAVGSPSSPSPESLPRSVVDGRSEPPGSVEQSRPVHPEHHRTAGEHAGSSLAMPDPPIASSEPTPVLGLELAAEPTESEQEDSTVTNLALARSSGQRVGSPRYRRWMGWGLATVTLTALGGFLLFDVLEGSGEHPPLAMAAASDEASAVSTLASVQPVRETSYDGGDDEGLLGFAATADPSESLSSGEADTRSGAEAESVDALSRAAEAEGVDASSAAEEAEGVGGSPGAAAEDEGASSEVSEVEVGDALPGAAEVEGVDTPSSTEGAEELDSPPSSTSPAEAPRAAPAPGSADEPRGPKPASKPRAARPRPTAAVHVGVSGLGIVEVQVGRKTLEVVPPGASERFAVGTKRVRWRRKGSTAWSRWQRIDLREGCELQLIVKPDGLHPRTIGTCR